MKTQMIVSAATSRWLLALSLTLLSLYHAAAVPPSQATLSLEATETQAVTALETKLRHVTDENQKIELVAACFATLKTGAGKMALIDMMDDRYGYVMPPSMESELLGVLLFDPDLVVRQRAAHALGYVSMLTHGMRESSACGADRVDSGHRVGLVRLFENADSKTMESVLYAMGRAQDTFYTSYLLRALRHPVAGVRAEAAFELYHNRNAYIKPFLEALSNRQANQAERVNAAQAMGLLLVNGEIGVQDEADYLVVLRSAAADANLEVRLAAAQALRNFQTSTVARQAQASKTNG